MYSYHIRIRGNLRIDRYRQLKAQRGHTASASPLRQRIPDVDYAQPKSVREVPSWFHPVSIVQVDTPKRQPRCANIDMENWLASFETDVLQYESDMVFTEVKLREALALSQKMETQPNRFYTAVCCALMERVLYTAATSTKLRKYSSVLFTLRDELYRSIYHIQQHADVTNPRTLSAFMEMSPYFGEMRSLKDKVSTHYACQLSHLIRVI